MAKFKLRLTGIGDDTLEPQTLVMEAYAKDAEELSARLDKEFNLQQDEKGWSMYIEWLEDDEAKMTEHDQWDEWLAVDCLQYNIKGLQQYVKRGT